MSTIISLNIKLKAMESNDTISSTQESHKRYLMDLRHKVQEYDKQTPHFIRQGKFAKFHQYILAKINPIYNSLSPIQYKQFTIDLHSIIVCHFLCEILEINQTNQNPLKNFIKEMIKSIKQNLIQLEKYIQQCERTNMGDDKAMQSLLNSDLRILWELYFKFAEPDQPEKYIKDLKQHPYIKYLKQHPDIIKLLYKFNDVYKDNDNIRQNCYNEERDQVQELQPMQPKNKQSAKILDEDADSSNRQPAQVTQENYSNSINSQKTEYSSLERFKKIKEEKQKSVIKSTQDSVRKSVQAVIGSIPSNESMDDENFSPSSKSDKSGKDISEFQNIMHANANVDIQKQRSQSLSRNNIQLETLQKSSSLTRLLDTKTMPLFTNTIEETVLIESADIPEMWKSKTPLRLRNQWFTPDNNTDNNIDNNILIPVKNTIVKEVLVIKPIVIEPIIIENKLEIYIYNLFNDFNNTTQISFDASGLTNKDRIKDFLEHSGTKLEWPQIIDFAVLLMNAFWKNEHDNRIKLLNLLNRIAETLLCENIRTLPQILHMKFYPSNQPNLSNLAQEFYKFIVGDTSGFVKVKSKLNTEKKEYILNWCQQLKEILILKKIELQIGSQTIYAEFTPEKKLQTYLIPQTALLIKQEIPQQYISPYNKITIVCLKEFRDFQYLKNVLLDIQQQDDITYCDIIKLVQILISGYWDKLNEKKILSNILKQILIPPYGFPHQMQRFMDKKKFLNPDQNLQQVNDINNKCIQLAQCIFKLNITVKHEKEYIEITQEITS